MDHPYDLQRFIAAQDPVFEQVARELQQGCKRSHWMWFIFPQIHGLGRSALSRKFAIAGQEEAQAYWRHAVLGPRLQACTQWVNQVEGRSVEQIFGTPDDMKFHSCMTLFCQVTPEQAVFSQALHKYFGGRPDTATMERL